MIVKVFNEDCYYQYIVLLFYSIINDNDMTIIYIVKKFFFKLFNLTILLILSFTIDFT